MTEASPPTADPAFDPLEAGRAALGRHAWQEAFENLSRADREGQLSGADLESLALAAFFGAHAEGELAVKERAFKAHEAEGNALRAAYLATDIARAYGYAGKYSIASAWKRRAEQAIGLEGETYAHGYLALIGSEAAGAAGDTCMSPPSPGRKRRASPRRVLPSPVALGILWGDGASRAEPQLRRSRRRHRWGKGELASPGRLLRPSPASRESVSPVVEPTEKDVETMPTQKIFKQRVRARMTKTGESYTAARRQLLQKTTDAADPAEDAGTTADATPTEQPDAGVFVVADEAMQRATGKVHNEWFALLDAWGATTHTHTEIARWLSEAHGVPPWWTQSVTVSYERARGMRARHQMRDGFSVSATKTIATTPERALRAFTDARTRKRWLPTADMRQRPTRAAMAARFDWSDPPSRVVAGVAAKGADKTLVFVTHEQIPDAESGERLKRAWRESLVALKALLEGD